MIYSDYILLKLNFISPEKDTSNNNIVNFNESSLKLVEKKLVCEIYENLKNSEGYIDKDQLLLFLLSLINLYEYYLLKINKHKFNLPEITCELKEKYMNEMIKSKSRSQEKFSFNKISKTRAEEKREINNFILEKINDEIVSRIKIMKKYGGLDEKGVYYISIPISKNINKDFNLLSINWSNYNHIHNKENNKKNTSNTKASYSFKPIINSKSKKLSVNFRRKIQSVQY